MKVPAAIAAAKPINKSAIRRVEYSAESNFCNIKYSLFISGANVQNKK
jgi:hypothetical protein